MISKNNISIPKNKKLQKRLHDNNTNHFTTTTLHVITPLQDLITQFPNQIVHNIQKAAIPFVQNRFQYQTIPTLNMILKAHNSAITPSPQNNQPFMFRPSRTTIQPSNLETIFFFFDWFE